MTEWLIPEQSPRIHPTAVISPKANLHETVQVGPYAVIGDHAEIGAETRIGAHAVLSGPLRLGARNQLFPFCAVGEVSQDKTARRSEPTSVVIGDDNMIREFVTIQRGTMKDYETKRGETRLGSRNWIMNYCHVAHDCIVGSDTIWANNTSLAGHVEVGDFVVMGGYTLVFQYCRIGAHAFTAFSSGITGDVPPFVTVQGNPAAPRGINKEGLRRRQFGGADIAAIEEAYKLIYRSGKLMADVKAELSDLASGSPSVATMRDFLLAGGKRPLQR